MIFAYAMEQEESIKKRKNYSMNIAFVASILIIIGLTLTSIIKSLRVHFYDASLPLIWVFAEKADENQPAAVISAQTHQSLIAPGTRVKLECRLQKQKVLHGNPDVFAELPKQIYLSIDPDEDTLRLGSLTGLSFERANSVITFSHSPGYLQKVQYKDNYLLNIYTGQLVQKITVPLHGQFRGAHDKVPQNAIYESIFNCINI